MKIMFVDPAESSLFSFRKELLDTLIQEGHDLVLCIESTQKIVDEYAHSLKIIDVPMNLKDKSIFSNLKLKKTYKKIIKEEKPDLILSYKIKPNIYCGLYAKNTPMIANITGLGNMFKNNGILSKIGIFLYRKSFKNVDWVFFQNNDGLDFFKANKIKINNYKIIPGSGVNLEKFPLMPLNKENTIVNFLFASRAIKEKGFDLFIQVIPCILAKYHNVHFNFLSAEEDVMANTAARPVFEKYQNNITIIPRTDNMASLYGQNDFLVSPSYYREGISNVLLESLACGRPIITTKDNPGCMEVLQDGKNGLGVLSDDIDSLLLAMEKAIHFTKTEIEIMGLAGRHFVEHNFDRQSVIKEYLTTIKSIELNSKKFKEV